MNKQSSYTIHLDGNILITTMVGPINIADTRRVFKQLKILILTLAGEPWANLIDARQWGLSAIDIDEILIEMEVWAKKAGRSHLVFVIGTEHAELKRFTLKKYMGNNLQKKEIQIVETLTQGLTWLAQHGFQLPSVNQSAAPILNQN